MISAPQRQPTRQRGFYVPTEEAQAYLHLGYRLIDDCPGFDEVMLAEEQDEQQQGEAQ
jgi:hypothetical protein